MKHSLLWAASLLAAALLAQACATLLTSTITTHALPAHIAAHIKKHLLPQTHPNLPSTAPAVAARLNAGLSALTSTFTLLLLPAALLFPGLVESWPSFLTLTVPSLRLSLSRIGEVCRSVCLMAVIHHSSAHPSPTHTYTQIHPAIAHFFTTRLLPLHPRLPSIFHHALTTPTIHLTPHHLLPATAALGLAFLYTSGSFVPERWAKHGLVPTWVDDTADMDVVGSGGSLEGNRRTLEGEVSRLLEGKASVAERFEVRYRGLAPLLRRKRSELARVSAGGGSSGAGGVRRGL